MDIEEFYDADERRRESREVELGMAWRDKHGVRYELNWIEATGEVYVMREPVPHITEDPFGGMWVAHGVNTPSDGMTVGVIGHFATQEQLESAFAGWETEMNAEDSTQWIVDRLAAAGAAVTSENAPDES